VQFWIPAQVTKTYKQVDLFEKHDKREREEKEMAEKTAKSVFGRPSVEQAPPATPGTLERREKQKHHNWKWGKGFIREAPDGFRYIEGCDDCIPEAVIDEYGEDSLRECVIIDEYKSGRVKHRSQFGYKAKVFGVKKILFLSEAWLKSRGFLD
jgi:hypothetical protein